MFVCWLTGWLVGLCVISIRCKDFCLSLSFAVIHGDLEDIEIITVPKGTEMFVCVFVISFVGSVKS